MTAYLKHVRENGVVVRGGPGRKSEVTTWSPRSTYVSAYFRRTSWCTPPPPCRYLKKGGVITADICRRMDATYLARSSNGATCARVLGTDWYLHHQPAHTHADRHPSSCVH